MRSFLALLALTVSVGSAAACEMHQSHAAIVAAATTLAVPTPVASASVTALPQSTMEEEAALAISKPELAAAAYGRGCWNKQQTTVYLTQ